MKNPLLKVESINWKPLWKKIEPWAKALVLAVPILIIIYLGIHIYDSYNYKANYSVDFKRANYRNKNLNFYIDEASNTPKILSTGLVNGVEYGEIGGSPITLVLHPKEFPLNKTISFSALFKGVGNWQVSVVCPNCAKDEKYNWHSLYFGFLNDYTLAAQYGTTSIYSLVKKDFKPASGVDQWLKNNAVTGTSLEILNNVYSQAAFANQVNDYQDGSSTEIKQRLRGAHQFYVYLKNKLNLDLIKKDLNMYDGADAVNVSLYDLNDNLVYQATIEDDGIAIKDTGTFAPPIKKTIEQDLPQAGIYKLAFEPVGKAGSDWMINYFKINTNKIVIADDSFFLDPVVLYTRTAEPKTLVINGGHSDSMQTVTAKNNKETKTIAITSKELGNNQNLDLGTGDWQISAHGDQVIRGANFALSKENYFEPFSYDFSKTDKPSLVIANYSFNLENSWTRAVYNLTNERLKQLKDLKNITLAFRDTSLDKKFKDEQDLRDQGFYPLAQFNDYILWGRHDLTTYKSTANNLVDWLKNLLPQGSTLRADDSLYISQNDFTDNNAPAGFSAVENILNFALRGNQDFYVYLNGSLKVQIDKQDINASIGKDELDVVLLNAAGQVICSKMLPDDGNTTANKKASSTVSSDIACGGLAKGPYTLRFIERVQPEIGASKSDFVIKQLKINSNKIVALDQINNLDPLSIFTDNTEANSLSVQALSDQPEKVVLGASKSTIEFKKNSKGDKKNKTLSKGPSTIAVTGGGVLLSGSNFAFKNDNWFNPEIIELRDSNDTDFAILQDVYDRDNFIKQINLNIE